MSAGGPAEAAKAATTSFRNPRGRLPPGARRGFTLIELLVALFITAIIFVMGYGAINQALNDRKAIDVREERLTAVETAMRVMVQDFTQLTPRPVRDETGNSSLPCLIGNPSGLSDDTPDTSSDATGSGDSSDSDDSGGLDLVAFTRTGWANPAGLQRPAEERVSYRLVNGVLERLSWPELDVTESTPFVTRKLLDHVKSIEFSYMDQSHQWTNQWPPLTSGSSASLGGNQTLRMRPLAVEVTLVLDDWGKIVRIIEVPT